MQREITLDRKRNSKVNQINESNRSEIILGLLAHKYGVEWVTYRKKNTLNLTFKKNY